MNKEDLKIVFLGTPEFAVESLDRLVSEGYNIVGVVTMPDKPAGRGHKMYSSPVKEYALAHNLKIMQPVKLKDPEFIEQLQQLDADLFIVIAFRMLPEVVWQMPRLGTFNLHASLLPKYRGAAPINWAVINGDTETGVTTFFLKHEIDTGDILRQEKIDILPEDNVGAVHDKLMHLGADLTLDTVRHITAGDLRPVPQNSLAGGDHPTPAPKIFKETCRINWEKCTKEIHNLVRGLSPYPAAWTELIREGSEPITVKVLETAITSQKKPCDNLTTGTVAIEGSRLWVRAADGWVEILNLQPQGKKAMRTADFLRGARLNDSRFN